MGRFKGVKVVTENKYAELKNKGETIQDTLYIIKKEKKTT